FGLGEHRETGRLPDLAVIVGHKMAATSGTKETAILGRAVLLDVIAEHADQYGRDGYGAGGLAGALLQAPGVEGFAGVRPGGADPGSGAGQHEFTPAGFWEGAGRQAQVGHLGWAHGGVVHAAVEGVQVPSALALGASGSDELASQRRAGD